MNEEANPADQSTGSLGQERVNDDEDEDEDREDADSREERISLTPSAGGEDAAAAAAETSEVVEATGDPDSESGTTSTLSLDLDTSSHQSDVPVTLVTKDQESNGGIRSVGPPVVRTPGSTASSSPSPRPGIKKRPAPAPPQAIRRTVCGSLQSIQFDLNAIGDRLAVIQERVQQLEQEFKSCKERMEEKNRRTDGDSGIDIVSYPLPKQTESISEYLELGRETCTLARRQEELMYQRTEHKLEQEHADLEFQIRQIDLIPGFKRTPDDETKCHNLIARLVDVIDQRNDVVENMTKINKRYAARKYIPVSPRLPVCHLILSVHPFDPLPRIMQMQCLSPCQLILSFHATVLLARCTHAKDPTLIDESNDCVSWCSPSQK